MCEEGRRGEPSSSSSRSSIDDTHPPTNPLVINQPTHHSEHTGPVRPVPLHGRAEQRHRRPSGAGAWLLCLCYGPTVCLCACLVGPIITVTTPRHQTVFSPHTHSCPHAQPGGGGGGKERRGGGLSSSSSSGGAGGMVRLAVQAPGGERLMGGFDPGATLADVIGACALSCVS